MAEVRPAEVEPHEGEVHGQGIGARLNWLRAGVLGANDGIVSTAGIVIGVAAATVERSAASPRQESPVSLRAP